MLQLAWGRDMKVYLAGGMRSNWRENVKDRVSADYLDPCETGYSDPCLYPAWDAAAVDACDVLFAYLAVDNPSGFGMTAEIGRASGLGKFIIFVDEKTPHGSSESRYLPIVRGWSTIVVDTLEEGIEHLHRLGLIYG